MLQLDKNLFFDGNRAEAMSRRAGMQP